RSALMHDDLAKRRAQMPEGTNRILSARSLASDHRRLYQLLEPGQAVLDAGCGNGAITVGILERVIPGGRVVGVDVNPRLIDEANRRYGGDPRLTFRAGDIYDGVCRLGPGRGPVANAVPPRRGGDKAVGGLTQNLAGADRAGSARKRRVFGQ